MNTSKQKVLASDNPFMSTLMAIAMDEYGSECFEWDVETLVISLEEDAGIELSDEVVAKIGCGLFVMGTDGFFKSLPDFIRVCNTISGTLIDPNMWEPADAFSVAQAVAEVLLINPPENGSDAFAPEIIEYISLVLRSYGCVTPPDSLKFITPDKLATQDIASIQEDPTMYAAGIQMGQEKSEELQEYLNGVLLQMMEEIKSIKWQHPKED